MDGHRAAHAAVGTLRATTRDEPAGGGKRHLLHRPNRLPVAHARGFIVLPRRWVVERTLAWLNRNRRLAKDFEATIESATTWLYIASVKLMSRRLGRVCELKRIKELSVHPPIRVRL